MADRPETAKTASTKEGLDHRSLIATDRSQALPNKRNRHGAATASAGVTRAQGNGRVNRGDAPKQAALSSRKVVPDVEEKRKKIKTYLTPKELREFKELLLAKREELAGDMQNLTSEALNRNAPGVGEQSTMPIHMADLGTDNWEQDFTLGLVANERAVVREIDEALERIADKTYGICVATDKPISRERLRAKPWAKYCIEYARLREEGRAP